MPEVRAREGEHFEVTLKRFRKVVERSGVLQDLRKREYYEKPSVKKKRKAIAARKRAARQARYPELS